MKYTNKTSIHELRSSYDLIIGWGTPVLEYQSRYNPTHYKLDYLINGKGTNIGQVLCGNKTYDMSILKQFTDKKVCIIIYQNKEPEIQKQIQSVLPSADTIVSRLVQVDGIQNYYSRSQEDVIMLDLIHKLGIENPSYADIGVCHPVVRNNTYLFYENGYTNGLLVEPNPEMVQLAQEYRPNNRIVTCGATSGEDSILTYYYSHLPGHNTFLEDIAHDRGILDNKLEIPVKNINTILKEHFENGLDVLDIDTEGMDYELLEALDTDFLKVKIICAEVYYPEIENCLTQKGYTHYFTTHENRIYVRKEELDKILA